jgi:hypothetical protein
MSQNNKDTNTCHCPCPKNALKRAHEESSDEEENPSKKSKLSTSSSDELFEVDKQEHYKELVKKSLEAHRQLIDCPLPDLYGMEPFIKWTINMLHKSLSMGYETMNLVFTTTKKGPADHPFVKGRNCSDITCNYNEIVEISRAPRHVCDVFKRFYNDFVIVVKVYLGMILPDNIDIKMIGDTKDSAGNYTTIFRLDIA